MNNDINGSNSSPSVGRSAPNATSSAPSPVNCEKAGDVGVDVNAVGSGSITIIEASVTSSSTMANNASSNAIANSSTTPNSIYASTSGAPATDQAAASTTGNNESDPNKPGPWEESKIKDLDDCCFKQLLDEAYSYKNPRDKENKSEIFLQLLEKAENEKEDHAFRTLTSLCTGGSLQDLVEAVRNDSLDCDYNYSGTRNRRHNHNSRPKKYSSVSSRQREGGSLPSNVNVSNCSLSVYEQPFLNEEEAAKQSLDKKEPRLLPNTANLTTCQRSINTLPSKTPTLGIVPTTGNNNCGIAEVTISTKACSGTNKNEFAIVGGCGGICETSKGVKGIKNTISLAAIGSATSATCAALATATAVVSGSTDTVVEMNENYMDQHNEMLTQGIHFERLNEMKIPRANIIRSDSSPNNTYVDDAIHFKGLDSGKSTVDTSYIQLDACKLNEKSEHVKMQSYSTTKTISKNYDENGNAVNTTHTANQKGKKKKFQSERNTKTLDVQSVEGYRGSDPIEELVKYIESSEDTKQNEKVNKFSENRKKDKKREKDKDKEKDKEKEKGKMKRSNSLEELRSCSKMDGDDVTLRNKSNIKNKNAEGKEKPTVSSMLGGGSCGANRKGERRSWGTEELTFLGENNAIDEVREKIKDKEKKKTREKDSAEKLEKVIEKRKKPDSNLVVSMESISCESAEFHVVTKKKKPKKQRQLTEDNRINNSSNSHKNPMYHNRKYQSNFSNDRDAYMGSFNTNNNNDKSRRKSTSSMPPSEKSDSSDLDSVHSLPIESANGRSPLQVHHHQNQPRSYAEIARKNDAAVASSVGAISAGTVNDSAGSNSSSNNSSHTELEVNAAASLPVIINTVTKKSRKIVKTDFPELISNEVAGTLSNSVTYNTANNVCTAQKPISYSQSLTSATGHKNEDPSTESTLQGMSPSETTVKNEKQIPKQTQAALPHQMLLQKSKSVETDSFYNSIDQYPALVKTIKRHSTTNACASDVVGASAIAPPSGTVSNQMNSITNYTTGGNSTPLSNKKSKASTKQGEEIIVEQQLVTTTPTATAKKSKREKLSTSVEHYSSVGRSASSSSTTTTTTIATTSSSSPSSLTTTFSLNINNKNQTNHNHQNYNIICNNNNNTNNKTSFSNSRNINNNANNSSNIGNSCINKYLNRPAVIILNDDSNAGGLSSGIGKEFTFGDFNEDELRLFDDNQTMSQHPSTEVFHKSYSGTATATSTLNNSNATQNFEDSGGTFNITSGSNASDVTNNSGDALILMQNTSSPNSSLVNDQSSDSGICNNYTTTTKEKRIPQQNSGTIATSNRSLSTDALVNNNTVYLSASTSPSKESLSSSASSSSSTSSNSSASSGTYVLNAPASKAITLSTAKSFKSKTTNLSYPSYNQKKINLDSRSHKNSSKPIANNASKVSTMNKRNSQRQEQNSCSGNNNVNVSRTIDNVSNANDCNATSTTTLPSLETCDDIETAIIAAARKAAAVAAEQTSTSVINKNYSIKSNINLPVSTTESTATASITTNPTPSNNLNNSNMLSNLNHSSNVSNSQKGINSTSSTTLLSQNKECSLRGGNNSCSSSCSLGSVTGVIVEQQQKTQQRKEIDLHFIQPTLATPINSIHNNETIINFIGSAWEEVANSKVTQFYDGQ